MNKTEWWSNPCQLLTLCLDLIKCILKDCVNTTRHFFSGVIMISLWSHTVYGSLVQHLFIMLINHLSYIFTAPLPQQQQARGTYIRETVRAGGGGYILSDLTWFPPHSPLSIYRPSTCAVSNCGLPHGQHGSRWPCCKPLLGRRPESIRGEGRYNKQSLCHCHMDWLHTQSHTVTPWDYTWSGILIIQVSPSTYTCTEKYPA